MAIQLNRLKRLRVYEEPSGSFAVDNSGTPGDFLDIPFIEGSISLDPGIQSQAGAVTGISHAPGFAAGEGMERAPVSG